MNLMKKVCITVLRWYQHILSLDQGVLRGYRRVCVFSPTCSEYCIEAVGKYGVMKGLFLGVKRVFRCHPWQKSHIDPLP